MTKIEKYLRMFEECLKFDEKDDENRSEEKGEDGDLNVFVDNHRKTKTSIGLGINHKRRWLWRRFDQLLKSLDTTNTHDTQNNNEEEEK